MSDSQTSTPLVNNYKVPSWNRQLCDFAIEHASCSRVHAVLVWHKILNRAFLIDLGSVHGTFIGRIRLEPHQPQQKNRIQNSGSASVDADFRVSLFEQKKKVPIDSELHFGASTRMFVIRERPNALATGGENSEGDSNHNNGATNITTNTSSIDLDESLLPVHSEFELDNLTEFNTAHNRRISTITELIGPSLSGSSRKRKKPMLGVHFSDADETINPEDIDPSIGRFRNLIQETFIPNKRGADAHEGASLGISAPTGTIKQHSPSSKSPSSSSTITSRVSSQPLGGTLSPLYHHNHTSSLALRLGLPVPNLAPDVSLGSFDLPSNSVRSVAFDTSQQKLTAHDILSGNFETTGSTAVVDDVENEDTSSDQPSSAKRKKYAKEAWPGKRPGFLIGPSA